MRNLEFKARLADPGAMLAQARRLGADLWGDLRQTDTYFAAPRGRLTPSGQIFWKHSPGRRQSP